MRVAKRRSDGARNCSTPIWSQFQRGDKIITVPFTVYVQRLK